MRRVSTPVSCFEIGDDRPQGVAVERIAVQRLGVQHELAALGLGRRRRDRHLAAELVGRPGLALADALDLGGVQRIDLVAALAVVLEAHPVSQGQEIGEALLSAPRRRRSCGGCRGSPGPAGCAGI